MFSAFDSAMGTVLHIVDGKPVITTLKKFSGSSREFDFWLDEVDYKIPIFTPSSYVVKGPPDYDASHPLLENVTKADWVDAQKKAFRLLIQALPESNDYCLRAREMVRPEKNFTKLRNALYQVYRGSVEIAAKRGEATLNKLRLNHSSEVLEFTFAFKSAVRHVRAFREFTDAQERSRLLSLITEDFRIRYQYQLLTLTRKFSLDCLSTYEIFSFLTVLYRHEEDPDEPSVVLAHSSKRKRSSNDSTCNMCGGSHHASKCPNRSKNYPRLSRNSGSSNRSGARGRSRGRGSPGFRNFSNVTCYRCGKRGHYANNC